VVFVFSVFSDNIKAPNVAGQFYPKEPDRLIRMIDEFISDAEVERKDRLIYGIIVPHAGYVYSGGVAAYAYKVIRGESFDVVVVIAASHRMRFNGVAIWPQGKFVTPLGKIEVEGEISEKLMELNPEIKDLPEAFFGEHSLEVQLPFLQRVVGDFKLVPLITGNLNLSSCRTLARSLKAALSGRKALVVASTDLSHYHKYEDAKRIDDLTLSLIGRGNAEVIYNYASQGKVKLCGLLPTTTFLYYIEGLRGRLRLLKYANSGDVTGDFSRVVGYASFIAYKENSQEGEWGMFTEKQKEKLLDIARSSIENYFREKKALEVTVEDALLNEKRGAFVTLKIHGNLRGCIGRIIADKPLAQVIADMATEAAFFDPRFPTLTREEFKDVDIEISVLSPIKKIKDINEIEVGKHGIIIRKGFYQGLLLPQVATEYGWDREIFLIHTCRKAGLPDDAYKSDAEIYIFSAEVFGEKE